MLFVGGLVFGKMRNVNEWTFIGNEPAKCGSLLCLLAFQKACVLTTSGCRVFGTDFVMRKVKDAMNVLVRKERQTWRFLQ